MSPSFLRSILTLLSVLACLGIHGASVPKFKDRTPQAKAVRALPSTNVFTQARTNTLSPDALKPSTEPFRFGPGDRLELEILGRSGTRTTTFVGADGKIYFDLLPGTDIWGLTLAETKETLERSLSAYYNRPQIAVSLTSVESKRIWVLGRLNKAGIYPLKGPTTLLESIARAGGLFTSRVGGVTDELADLNHSFIIRRGEMLPVNFQKLLRSGDTSQNVYLEADDFIYLPSSLSSEVYVLGAVNGPRPVAFSDNMSLITAIAKALGTQPSAHLSQVAIVRGSLSEPKIAIVDFKAILAGKVADVRLEAHDMVYVPFSPYRTLERYAKLITDTFVRTVAANEGGRAARPTFEGIGVSNPITP